MLGYNFIVLLSYFDALYNVSHDGGVTLIPEDNRCQMRTRYTWDGGHDLQLTALFRQLHAYLSLSSL